MNDSYGPVNSKEYWDGRFSSGDWERNQGRRQTRYFYVLLAELLPDWFKDRVRRDSDLRIVDFGCAEGDGIPVLSAELDHGVIGVDFSAEAVKNAAAQYPGFTFEQGDVRSYRGRVDVAILSNIIEHFPDPYGLLESVAARTKRFLVVMVPLEETDLMAEHCYTFRYQNIPLAVGNYQLVYFTEHDCRKDPEQLFLARQVLLIYACCPEDVRTLKVSELDGLLFLRRRQQEEEAAAAGRLLAGQAELREKLDAASGSLSGAFSAAEERLSDRVRAAGDRLSETLEEKLSAAEKRVTDELETLRARERESREAIAGQLAENAGLMRELSAEQTALALQAVEKTLQAGAIQARNDALTREKEELTRQYADLVERFNNLNDHYGFVVSENVRIVQSRTYRIAEWEKKLLERLHLIGFFKFLLSVRRNGWKEARRLRQLEKAAQKHAPVQIADSGETIPDISALTPDEQWRQAHRQICLARLSEPWTEATKTAAEAIGTRRCRGIVVYPHAVHWEPIQRPQQLLRSFAKAGFLCFFCENAQEGQTIREAEENLFVVYGEEFLLPALQNRCPIVLVTYHNQSVFCDLLPEKVLWFDALDNFEFFSHGGTREAAELYRRLIQNADLVTYSADALADYVKARPDAVKLNNAVCPEDFAPGGEREIAELEDIRRAGRKIVGYYGAIEEWFDVDAIRAILDHTDCEVVLIGRCGLDLSALSSDRLHLPGQVPYGELKSYSRYFDVALIPFKVNKLTDSVSPVKFFEYAAQGIPVLSANIREMRAYADACGAVLIYRDHEEMLSQLNGLLSSGPDRDALRALGAQNSWQQRAETVLDALFSAPLGLRALAALDGRGAVSVETVTFFKYDGTNYYSGGAERYLLDLHEICREIGVPYRVLQYGSYSWVRFYGETEVVAMAARENSVDQLTVPLMDEMDAAFRRATCPEGAVNVLSPFYILRGRMDVPTIGISHGISWDSEYNHFTDGNTFWQTNRNVIDAAGECDRMISVDTNTCNWFQTLDYDTARRITYVPNYVDGQTFSPREDFDVPRDRIVITYPRRLYAPRGLYAVLDILDEVLERYANVEFRFVGKGFESDTKHVEKKIRKWGDRVKMYSMPPDRMNDVYRDSDISLVPTMYSEGTSLSCLEALSSGNAVICTRVGGLTDLILDGFNGLLIEPNSRALKEALCRLLEDPEEMARLKRNAVMTAAAFSKEKWKRRWKQILLSELGERRKREYTPPRRCRIDLARPEELREAAVLKTVREYLENGWFVFIACKNDPLRLRSFGRLQFIESDEDLYFEPEVTISGSTLLS